MTEPMRQPPTLTPEEIAWSGVSTSFAAFGRVFLCLDREFRVVHASYVLDELRGRRHGGRRRRPADRRAHLRRALRRGRRAARRAARRRASRGWRALVAGADGLQRFVALSAAPICPPPEVACDPRVAFAVILRPAEEDMPATARRLLGVRRHRGALARHAEDLRPDREPPRERHHGAALRRERSRQGGRGAGDPRALAAPRRSPSWPSTAAPCPASCSRARCSATCAAPSPARSATGSGASRSPPKGTLLPRRGRRPAAAAAGEAAAGAAGRLVRARRREPHASEPGAGDRRHPHRPGARGARRPLPRGSLLPAARRADRHSAAASGAPEDVEPLARAILARVAARQGRALRLSPDALRDLLAHDWPGNVRELENALEYAVAICHGQTILPEDLPTFVRREQAAGTGTDGTASRRAEALTPPAQALPAPLSENIAQARRRAEAEELRRALDAHGWRRTEAARALGMSRTTLWRKMREFGFAS